MTGAELQRQYQISNQVLQDFAAWRVIANPRAVSQAYSSTDLPILRLITQLRRLGFTQLEITAYLQCEARLVTSDERQQLLTTKRQAVLASIHSGERQIAAIDYLQFKIREEQN